MGAFKSYLIEQMELEDSFGFRKLNHGLIQMHEPEPNQFEAALINGERLLGKDNNFVASCSLFYKRNKYLSEAQIYRLENPKFKKRY